MFHSQPLPERRHRAIPYHLRLGYRTSTLHRRGGRLRGPCLRSGTCQSRPGQSQSRPFRLLLIVSSCNPVPVVWSLVLCIQNPLYVGPWSLRLCLLSWLVPNNRACFRLYVIRQATFRVSLYPLFGPSTISIGRIRSRPILRCLVCHL